MSHQYLEYVRALNKAKASKCHICGKQSTGINAYDHQIKFVCAEHEKGGSKISYNTYMSIICKCGQSALFPRCNKNPDHCPKIAEDKEQDAIWATQISFEE